MERHRALSGNGIKLGAILFSLCVLLPASPLARASSWPGQPAVVLFIGSPSIVSLNEWTFLNVTLQDYLPGSLGMILFAVFKNAAGQTVAVETGSVIMSEGETANCYAPVFNMEPGNSTVYMFVVSGSNVPLSSVVTIQVSF